MDAYTRCSGHGHHRQAEHQRQTGSDPLRSPVRSERERQFPKFFGHPNPSRKEISLTDAPRTGGYLPLEPAVSPVRDPRGLATLTIDTTRNVLGRTFIGTSRENLPTRPFPAAVDCASLVRTVELYPSTRRPLF